MFWRITNDTLKWLWPAVFGAAVAFAGVAVAASSVWPEAKVWAEGEFLRVVKLLNDPLFWGCTFVVFVVWLAAFIWSGHRVERAALVAHPAPASDTPQYKTPVDAIIEAKHRSNVASASAGLKVHERAPPIPITLNSVGAYIRGFPTVRNITREICERVDQDLTNRQENGALPYSEEALAFGLCTIAELDQALVADRELVIRMGAYLIPEKIYPDFSLGCLFNVLGGRMGTEAYWDIIKGLKHQSSSEKWCKEMEEIYALITAY